MHFETDSYHTIVFYQIHILSLWFYCVKLCPCFLSKGKLKNKSRIESLGGVFLDLDTLVLCKPSRSEEDQESKSKPTFIIQRGPQRSESERIRGCWSGFLSPTLGYVVQTS